MSITDDLHYLVSAGADSCIVFMKIIKNEKDHIKLSNKQLNKKTILFDNFCTYSRNDTLIFKNEIKEIKSKIKDLKTDL